MSFINELVRASVHVVFGNRKWLSCQLIEIQEDTAPIEFSKFEAGGQTGADQGALDAALDHGHPCGGWCPRGRKSEAGPIPEQYPLQEHQSANYKTRTEANVLDSDGTLVFTYGRPSGGTKLTVEFAKKHRKPYYILDLEHEPVNIDPEKVWTWGWKHEVIALNVAGPRESKHPGTQVIVLGIMGQVLRFAQGCYPIKIESWS